MLSWRPLCEPGNGGWITSISVSPFDSKRVLAGGDMLGVAFSEDQGESWKRASGFKSWEIADFTWNPSIPNDVWVGTMSGPYESVDGGRTWTERRAGFPQINAGAYSAPIQKILFDPNDHRHLLAFGGSHRIWNSPPGALWGAVWESRNGGISWSRISTIPSADSPGGNIVAASFAAKSSAIVYVAVAKLGVFVSGDGGRSWTARNQGLPHTDAGALAASPAHPKTLWVALNSCKPAGQDACIPGGIYKSVDGGLTWRQAQGPSSVATTNVNTTARYKAIAVAPSAPNILVTADYRWGTKGIYISADGGQSWRVAANKNEVDTPWTSGLGMTTVAFDPQNANVAFAGGAESILRTLDGGKTWTDATSIRTGAGWRGRGFEGFVCESVAFDQHDSLHVAISGCDHGNFWQSFDGMQSWIWGGSGMPDWGGSASISFSVEGTTYVGLGQDGRFNGIGRTSDNGKTWEIEAGPQYGLPVPEKDTKSSAVAVYAMQNDANTAWATIGGQLYKTADGKNWKIVCEGPGLNSFATSPREPLQFFVSGTDGIYETDDGQTFSLIAGSPRHVTRIAVDSRGCVYATTWRAHPEPAGLWRLKNGTWTLVRNDPYIYSVAIDPSDPDRIAVITNDDPYHDHSFASGVWISEDGGVNWSQENDGLAVARGRCVAFDPHNPETLIAGTGGGGFYIARWPRKQRAITMPDK
ncbi:MAG: hypothetical protein P4L33_20805 [Capsulimonadaceae bacterium]|nr:hypothetical protein [Capsulimonadaceae bacterium]